ncbi:MAG: SgcJ/EcaC family oxidoreductase [Acidobacteriota bacterium]
MSSTPSTAVANPPQALDSVISDATRDAIRADVEATSQAWIACFNRGDAAACAAGYTEDAVMTAQPIADLRGREAIHKFWADVLAGDPGTLRYDDPQVHVLDSQTAVLSSGWSMSRLGSGIITLELWQLQDDGAWRLSEDRFEIRHQNG